MKLNQIFTIIVKSIETLCSKSIFLSSVYNWLFYKRMVDSEICLSGVKEGNNVLHVGCGSLPYTSVALANHGVRVVAIDSDAKAVLRAKKMVSRLNLSDKIKILHQNGLAITDSKYDAVWLSLHAEPKTELINKYISLMKKDFVLVYRNPGTITGMFYHTCIPYSDYSSCKNVFGNKSIIVRKQSNSKSISLKVLEPEITARIESVPPLPLLSALGFRPGKTVRVKVRGILNGPIIAEIEGKCSALTQAIAESIKVTPLNESAR